MTWLFGSKKFIKIVQPTIILVTYYLTSAGPVLIHLQVYRVVSLYSLSIRMSPTFLAVIHKLFRVKKGWRCCS